MYCLAYERPLYLTGLFVKLFWIVEFQDEPFSFLLAFLAHDSVMSIFVNFSLLPQILTNHKIADLVKSELFCGWLKKLQKAEIFIALSFASALECLKETKWLQLLTQTVLYASKKFYFSHDHMLYKPLQFYKQ